MLKPAEAYHATCEFMVFPSTVLGVIEHLMKPISEGHAHVKCLSRQGISHVHASNGDHLHVASKANILYNNKVSCSLVLCALWLQATPAGNTKFQVGLQRAFQILETAPPDSGDDQPDPRPMIILLSDSGDWRSAETLQWLQQTMQKL